MDRLTDEFVVRHVDPNEVTYLEGPVRVEGDIRGILACRGQVTVCKGSRLGGGPAEAGIITIGPSVVLNEGAEIREQALVVCMTRAGGHIRLERGATVRKNCFLRMFARSIQVNADLSQEVPHSTEAHFVEFRSYNHAVPSSVSLIALDNRKTHETVRKILFGRSLDVGIHQYLLRRDHFEGSLSVRSNTESDEWRRDPTDGSPWVTVDVRGIKGARCRFSEGRIVVHERLSSNIALDHGTIVCNELAGHLELGSAVAIVNHCLPEGSVRAVDSGLVWCGKCDSREVSVARLVINDRPNIRAIPPWGAPSPTSVRMNTLEASGILDSHFDVEAVRLRIAQQMARILRNRQLPHRASAGVRTDMRDVGRQLLSHGIVKREYLAHLGTLCERIEGDIFNVLACPVHELLGALRADGWTRYAGKAVLDCFRDPLERALNPFQAAWRTEDVVGLAREIIRSGSLSRAPELADVLGAAGCTDVVLLGRLRDWKGLTPFSWPFLELFRRYPV